MSLRKRIAEIITEINFNINPIYTKLPPPKQVHQTLTHKVVLFRSSKLHPKIMRNPFKNNEILLKIIDLKNVSTLNIKQ